MPAKMDSPVHPPNPPSQDAPWHKPHRRQSSPPYEASSPQHQQDEQDNTEPRQDTDMICQKDNQDEWRDTVWKPFQAKCATHIYHDDHLQPDISDEWSPGPYLDIPLGNMKQKHFDEFPLFTMVKYDNDVLKLPPKHVKLSDELVYLVSKCTTRSHRKATWPADFDGTGDIRASRVPQDPPPIICVFGLPSIPVWKGYYILAGNSFMKHIRGYLLANKPTDRIKCAEWVVGSIFIGEDLWCEFHNMDPRPQVVRQAHHPTGELNLWLDGEKRNRQSRDRVASCYTDLAGVIHANGLKLAPIWRLHGFNVRFSAHPEASVMEDPSVPIDYDKFLARPYEIVPGTRVLELKDIDLKPEAAFAKPQGPRTLKLSTLTQQLMRTQDSFNSWVTEITRAARLWEDACNAIANLPDDCRLPADEIHDQLLSASQHPQSDQSQPEQQQQPKPKRKRKLAKFDNNPLDQGTTKRQQ